MLLAQRAAVDAGVGALRFRALVLISVSVARSIVPVADAQRVMR